MSFACPGSILLVTLQDSLPICFPKGGGVWPDNAEEDRGRNIIIFFFIIIIAQSRQLVQGADWPILLIRLTWKEMFWTSL